MIELLRLVQMFSAIELEKNLHQLCAFDFPAPTYIQKPIE